MGECGTFVTRNGVEVSLRWVKKGDADLLLEMFYRLSPETRRLRFHLYTAKISEERVRQEAEALSNLDPQLQVAIVGTVVEEDGREHAVGVARFMRASPTDTEAEVAVVVRDDFQRKGLGKHLLLTLADKAREIGITHFSAWVMSDNIRLMKLIKDMELKNVESESRYGMTKIRVPL
ncbi:MAG: GNAT family N-acetyltransferase [Chloroflexi bacterium]|nr:MAG: GNAT family N-acetyltransferase [Chloroflexota bacterium]